MRKASMLIVSIIALTFFTQFLSSCKKSHETPAKPKLSFAQTTETVSESDGIIDIIMKLDKPSPEAISISYELSGTAKDKVSAGTSSSYDYEITSTYLETKIPKGETTGTITIKLYSDFRVEDNELIEISILNVDSDNIEITRDDTEKITVTQEDGLGVFLEWGIGTGENYLDVDMDLFLWAKGTSTPDLGLTNVAATTPSFTSPEFIFLPTALLDDGNYGLSCNYYQGTVSPMNFVVSFIPFISGTAGTAVTRNGSYTIKNINAWDTSGSNPLLVETFEKSGTDFLSFSDITPPDTLSRVMSSPVPADIKRETSGKGITNQLFNSLLQK